MALSSRPFSLSSEKCPSSIFWAAAASLFSLVIETKSTIALYRSRSSRMAWMVFSPLSMVVKSDKASWISGVAVCMNFPVSSSKGLPSLMAVSSSCAVIVPLSTKWFNAAWVFSFSAAVCTSM